MRRVSIGSCRNGGTPLIEEAAMVCEEYRRMQTYSRFQTFLSLRTFLVSNCSGVIAIEINALLVLLMRSALAPFLSVLSSDMSEESR